MSNPTLVPFTLVIGRMDALDDEAEEKVKVLRETLGIFPLWRVSGELADYIEHTMVAFRAAGKNFVAIGCELRSVEVWRRVAPRKLSDALTVEAEDQNYDPPTLDDVRKDVHISYNASDFYLPLLESERKRLLEVALQKHIKEFGNVNREPLRDRIRATIPFLFDTIEAKLGGKKS